MSSQTHVKKARVSWGVVGAGPIGCYLASALREQRGLDSEQLRVFDAKSPLSSWKHRARNSGMSHLRSPSVHHLDLRSSALEQFQRRSFAKAHTWKGKGRSPSLELFHAHCRHVLERNRIEESWTPAFVDTVSVTDGAYSLQTPLGQFEVENLILALGPCWGRELPEWLSAVETRTHHLLDPNFFVDSLAEGRSLAVIGGGMTAVQAALALSKKHRITLFTRRPIEVYEFDVSSGWMGPMKASFRKRPLPERRALVDKSRRSGTINSAVNGSLKTALKRGALSHHQLVAPSCEQSGKGVLVRDEEQEFHFDKVLLGTGFVSQLQALHQQIARDLKAPLSPCGLPDLDPHLQWLPNLYVVGCHAELQLGAGAGNIIGGRLAAERIFQALS